MNGKTKGIIIGIIFLLAFGVGVFMMMDTSLAPGTGNEQEEGMVYPYTILSEESMYGSELEAWYRQYREGVGVFTQEHNGNTYILLSQGQKERPGYGIGLVSINIDQRSKTIDLSYEEVSPMELNADMELGTQLVNMVIEVVGVFSTVNAEFLEHGLEVGYYIFEGMEGMTGIQLLPLYAGENDETILMPLADPMVGTLDEQPVYPGQVVKVEYKDSDKKVISLDVMTATKLVKEDAFVRERFLFIDSDTAKRTITVLGDRGEFLTIPAESMVIGYINTNEVDNGDCIELVMYGDREIAMELFHVIVHDEIVNDEKIEIHSATFVKETEEGVAMRYFGKEREYVLHTKAFQQWQTMNPDNSSTVDFKVFSPVGSDIDYIIEFINVSH